jgi:beta-glucosidase/6-phospho-beta-glucosidase/beta-galactosidase
MKNLHYRSCVVAPTSRSALFIRRAEKRPNSHNRVELIAHKPTEFSRCLLDSKQPYLIKRSKRIEIFATHKVRGVFHTGHMTSTVFLKGVALSVYQNSSDTHSNWTAFIRQRGYFGQDKDAFASSNDFWNNYETDILLAKELGCTAFRFSFEWSRFQPKGPGSFDPAAVDHYHRILDCMVSHGMVPMATLHHFTHPCWFERLGGFEKEENISMYVEYCTLVFEHFGQRIQLFATFNEPTCFSAVGYIIGLWCPGKVMRFRMAGQVLCNLLRAHCAAYKAMKSMPGGQEAQIGIVHQHVSFKPRNNVWYIKYLCRWMTNFFGTKTILDFFTTGIFKWRTPFGLSTHTYHVPDAPRCVDWWGVNFYSQPMLDWRFRMVGAHDKDVLSDSKFRLCPEGMRQALHDASMVGVPIYVTETGMADSVGTRREQLIKEYYAQVLAAIADGCDVRGIFFWTLMDNIEWHEGFHLKFGLYEWCPVVRRGQPPRLRPGGHALRDIHAAWPDCSQMLRQYALESLHPSVSKPSSQGHSRTVVTIHALSTLDPVSEEQEQRLSLLPQAGRVDSISREL